MNNEKHPKHPHPVFPETPGKGADKEEKEKREQSEKKKEQLKKLLVFAGLGILFLISLWLIFSPSAEERQKEERTAGLNETVPQATDGELPDDKLKGYELGRDEEKESHRQETLGNLYDYFEKKDETREQELSEEAASDGLHPIERSVSRYEETSQMVHSFYEPPAYDYEKEALREELDMIRSELATLKEEKEEEIDHLELLEKSYRMAAKYFPASGDANSRDAYTRSQERLADAPAPKTAATAQRTALPAVELLPEKRAIVSSLDRPMSDSAFIAEYGHKERNFGFRSADVPASSVTRNTLRVVVDRTTTLQHGDFVQLRLLESARLHDLSSPSYPTDGTGPNRRQPDEASYHEYRIWRTDRFRSALRLRYGRAGRGFYSRIRRGLRTERSGSQYGRNGRDLVHLCLLRQRPDPFRGGPRGDAGSKSAPAKETPHRKSDAQRRVPTLFSTDKVKQSIYRRS